MVFFWPKRYGILLFPFQQTQQAGAFGRAKSEWQQTENNSHNSGKLQAASYSYCTLK